MKLNTVCMQMKDLSFEGNVIDNGWIENLKYDNGKPNWNAIFILSEIVSLYEEKLNNYKLKKSYESLGKRFGISKDQARLACNFLVKNKIIIIEFKTIKIFDRNVNNVMFIEPIFENLKKITGNGRFRNEKYFTVNDIEFHNRLAKLNENILRDYYKGENR
jgi:hypothetical protein